MFIDLASEYCCCCQLNHYLICTKCRLKKQEWAKFAESAQDILQKMDAITKEEVGPKEPPEQIILDEESEPPVEKAREKIVISIQDKDGHQQMRVYKVILIFLAWASIATVINSAHIYSLPPKKRMSILGLD